MLKLKTAEGTEYQLEFDRNSIVYLEKMGFSLETFSSQPMTQYPLLFKGAFFKNHRFMRDDEKEKLFENIKNRDKLMAALIEMVTESYQSLASSNDEGNVDWEKI